MRRVDDSGDEDMWEVLELLTGLVILCGALFLLATPAAVLVVGALLPVLAGLLVLAPVVGFVWLARRVGALVRW
jgi:hypothetical protein